MEYREKCSTCGWGQVASSKPVIAFQSLHVKSADPVAARIPVVFRQHDHTHAVCM